MRLLIILVIALLLAGVGFAVVEGNRLAEVNHRLIDSIRLQAGEHPLKHYYPEQLEGLPSPVQGYLDNALTPGMPIANRVRVQQHGVFNISEDAPQWLPLKATGLYSSTPPGRVWSARLSIAPPLALHVTDSYHAGTGGLSVSLLGALPVVEANPAPELAQGELMTWLAESVWFPTALLPGNGVTWTAIDEQNARASVADGHHHISLDFHFNNRNEVVSVSSPSRAREVNGSYRMVPWSCHYRSYSKLNGVKLPLEGEAIWHLAAGDLPYVRVRIDKLEYDPQI